jgi:hypothetical protein
MPVIAPVGDPEQAYRSFTWGDLLDLFMIDVRSYRSPAIDDIDTSTPGGAAIFDPDRTTLGAAQKASLKSSLSSAAACWKVLGNPYNMGVWRLADTDDPSQPIVAHDFTCGSLTPDPDVILDRGGPTADAYDFYRRFQDLSVERNPGRTYANFINQGYGLATFTPDEVKVTFRAVNPYASTVEMATIAEFTVPKGSPCLTTTSYSIPCYSCDTTDPRGQTESVTTTCSTDAPPVDPGDDTGPVAASPNFTG